MDKADTLVTALLQLAAQGDRVASAHVSALLSTGPPEDVPPATWSSLSDLLAEALELEPGPREAWLQRLTVAEPAQALTLRRLLAAHVAGKATVELPGSPAVSTPAAPEERPGLAPGDRVGPYVLLRGLGCGGMADVWLAERADGAFTRTVALKLPLLSRLRRDLTLRYARERDILAGLEHPNIARLYDAGVSVDGQPYLAMEYVDGQAITAWCDGHAVDIPTRLRLFAQVLAAVQFAHANLVIHRDLKPSNILVTDDGQVRLLDFGIAKLLAADEQAHETQLTQWTGRALTPSYASPEQIKGEALTTASDVYTLGVVLFELLTGTRPYRLKVDSVAQLEQAIVAADPLRPSASVSEEAAASARGVSTSRLVRELAGDLDTIVLKALAKAPAERYPTVAALGDDLQRHLEGQPVRAQPASTWYRMRKFAARHRWPVIATLAAVTALLGVAAVALTQARRATAQQRVALAEARRATAVKDFLIEILNSGDPAGDTGKAPGELTVQQAVDRASNRIGSALTDQPDAKMEVLETLSSVYSSLDLNDRSAALLQEALALSERHDGIPHANQAKFLAGLAGTAMFSGRYDEAQRWIDRSDAVFGALGDTTSMPYAHVLKMKGNLARRASDFQRAIPLLERAAELFRARYPNNEGRLGALFFLAQTLRAVDAGDRAVSIADEAVALAGQSEKPGFDVPNAYSLRAAIRESNGDLQGADSDYTTAGAAYRKTVGPEHFLTSQNEGLHGMALVEMGQRDRGLKMVEESTALLSKIRAGSNTHVVALERLGAAQLQVGSFGRAIPALERSSALWAERHDELQRTGSTVKLSRAYAALGRYDEARALLNEALAVRSARQHSSLFAVAEVHLALSALALEQGNVQEARAELERVLTSSPAATRGDLSRQVLAHAALAHVAHLRDDAAAALAASERAVVLADSAQVRQLTRITTAALEAKGSSFCRFGQAAAGEPLLARAAAMVANNVDSVSPLLSNAQLAHAECLLPLGRQGEARSLVESASRVLGANARVAPHFLERLRAVQAKVQEVQTTR
jgi:tetratricopeptide (TPR) repeat protein